MRRPFKSTPARPPELGKVIPFQRPSRPPASPPAPEHLLRATEASLRATDVYLRLLSFRLDLARHANSATGLGRLDGAALLRIAVASDALQSAAESALAQIDCQAATKARQAAELAREGAPHGR
jgi:hypothetical protein